MIRSFFLWCKHVVYAIAVLAIIACLAEIGLRVYDSATAQVTRRDLYDRGIVCKSWFVHHSLKPSHAFVVKNPDTGERLKATINSLGLRGPEPAIPKPPGIFRVLCLGDDSTFAAGTREADTFCARLQTELAGRIAPSVEVINAGVPEYCPLLSYLQFRHELLSLQPDLIVLNFDMSGVADDYLLRRQAVMNRDGQPLTCAHPALELPRSCKADREGLLLLPQFARQRINCLLANRTLDESSRSIDSPRCRYLWLTDQAPDWSVHIGQALSPLKHLSELARSTGASLVVAACPAPWQVSPRASAGNNVREEAGIAADACLKSRRPFEMIGEFCSAHQIPFCDVSANFAQGNDPERLYLNNAAAFSPEGHALYARELAGFLLRNTPPASGTGPTQDTTPQPAPRISTRWK